MNKHEIDGLVEPSDWEQGNWPEATEAYVRGLESALTTLSARVETLEAALGEICRDSNPDWTERRVYANDAMDDIHTIATAAYYAKP